ncbi:Ribonuclease G [Morganella morganii]|nr:Ribonuclease G [Morganella morganii]
MAGYCDEDGGFIIRTAAEGVGEEELTSDAAFLRRLWTKVIQRKKRNTTRTKIYGELALAHRILRDFAGESLDRIRIDSRLSFKELQEFVDDYIPEMTAKLELYQGSQPIFDLYDTENEIQRAMERKVEMKSGGYLIIDQTEAMTTIDINTGAFVGHRNLEETIFNTNIEATQAIARQLRLRNLGGIIIIDFIDMTDEDHRRRVLSSLELALAKDRVKTTINGFSQLGTGGDDPQTHAGEPRTCPVREMPDLSGGAAVSARWKRSAMKFCARLSACTICWMLIASSSMPHRQ